MPTAYTTTQIISQLTTSWGGSLDGYTFSWPSSLKTISFSINAATPTNVGGVKPAEGGAFLVKMDAIQVATATLAFQLWDDVIGKTLVKSTSPSANITLNYSSNTSGNGTYTQLYGTAINNTTHQLTLGAGQVWLSSSWATNGDRGMMPGGYGLFTMIHEIGHALGLSHPGDYNAGSGAAITYANNALFAQDNRQYTVMSYFGGYLKGVGWQQDGTSANYIYPQTLMVYDIAAIQAKYGADTTTRLTNTVYGFNCSLAATDPEDKIFDFTLNSNPIFTIWDAAGTDTLDGSGYAGDQTINLTPGAYSSVDGMIENVAIAFNCWIEAAVGGKGADTIIGNGVNNIITGGVGADQLDGGNGADLYMIYAAAEHPAGEIIADTGTPGVDEVRFASTKAKETLTLSAGDTGIETVVIGTGTGTTAITSGKTALNINASGVLNGLNIIGNAGTNTLTGTAYADTVTGGAGADLFVFNTLPASPANSDIITDFQPGVDHLQFSKAVFTAFTSTVGKAFSATEFWSGAGVIAGHDTSDRILYNTATGNLYYDADGNGAGSAVLVALVGVTTHPALAATDIQVIA
ncbi:MAG: M10 family metallopeptidase C-terminal domain-containing protein [Chlorobium sp.]